MRKMTLLLLTAVLIGCAPAPIMQTATATIAPTIAPTETVVPTKTPTKEPTIIRPTVAGQESWRIKKPKFATFVLVDSSEEVEKDFAEIAVEIAQDMGIEGSFRWEYFMYLGQIKFSDVQTYYDEQTTKLGFGKGEHAISTKGTSEAIKYQKGDQTIYIIFWQDAVGTGIPSAFVYYQNFDQ